MTTYSALPSGYAIRPAAQNDAGSIARVHVQSWEETYRGLIPDAEIDRLTVEERTRRWLEILAHPSPPLIVRLVTNRRGEVAGFISGGPARAPKYQLDYEITAIYVLKVHHGLGLGRALMVDLVRQAQRQEAESLYLWVLQNNPALGFYYHMGGEAFAVEETVRSGQVLIETMMIWRNLDRLINA